MLNGADFADVLHDANTFGWPITMHASELGAHFAAEETVVGFLASPQLCEKTGRGDAWGLWVLTDSNLMLCCTYARDQAAEARKFALSNVSCVRVHTAKASEKDPRHDDVQHTLTLSEAEVRFSDGSKSLHFSGRTWLEGWGEHPTTLGWTGAVGFFGALGVLPFG